MPLYIQEQTSEPITLLVNPDDDVVQTLEPGLDGRWTITYLRLDAQPALRPSLTGLIYERSLALVNRSRNLILLLQRIRKHLLEYANLAPSKSTKYATI